MCSQRDCPRSAVAGGLCCVIVVSVLLHQLCALHVAGTHAEILVYRAARHPPEAPTGTGEANPSPVFHTASPRQEGRAWWGGVPMEAAAAGADRDHADGSGVGQEAEPETELEPEPEEEPKLIIDVLLVKCQPSNKKLLAFLQRQEAESLWSSTTFDVLSNSKNVDGETVQLVCTPKLTVSAARQQLADALGSGIEQIPCRWGGTELADDR